MGPLTWNARAIHRDHDNGTIRSVSCLHVASPLGLNYVEGLKGLLWGGTSTLARGVEEESPTPGPGLPPRNLGSRFDPWRPLNLVPYRRVVSGG